MIKKWLYIGAVLSAVAFLTACGSDSPERMLASAKTYLAKKDGKPAVIQLKNALQKRPNWAEARYLLGQALLVSGDPSSAVVELRKARDLKYPDDQVVPTLARVLVLQQQFKAVTDEFGSAELGQPLSVAELKTSLAVSFLSQGEWQKGEVALNSALKAEPTYVPALLVKARMLAIERHLDAAFELIDKVLAGASDNHEVWNLKGDLLLQAKADMAGALDAYRRALAIRSDSLPAHTGIVLINLAKNDLDGAAQQIGALKKVLPRHPQAKYLEAQVAFQRADNETARELTLQLLKLAPNDVRLLLLAGAIELRNRALLQAESYLQKGLQISPDSRPVRLLLAQAYVSSGQSAKALDLVAPLLEGDKPDGPAMSIAAQSHVLAGDLKKAEALYARAAKLNPADAKTLTSLALTHMTMGEVDAGFGELQRIASEDSGTTADTALIRAHMMRKDYAAALTAVDSLERKEPNKPLTFQLRGTAEMGLKQREAARKSFERALSLDQGYFPAVQSLAALDLADKKPEAASKRFEDLLVLQPSHPGALLAIAELRARGGSSSEDVAKLLGKAIRLNSGDVAPRLRLIELHIASKQFGAALVSAQDAVAAIPASPDLLDALGRVQWLSGDSNQAEASFNKLTTLQPNSPVPHMRLADVYLAAKNTRAAMQSLTRALAIKPDLLSAQRNVIKLELLAGRVEQALTMARTVQTQRPNEGVGFLLEGDAQASRKDLNAATAVYRRGMKVGASTPLAMRLHAALTLSGKRAEADTVAASWLKDHPQDVAFLMHLGRFALERKGYDDAERLFGEVTKLQPNNVIALNNLAWVMTKLNKPGALTFAQKANELKPNQPAVMDTLAVALAADNQLPNALDLQKKVVKLQPGNNDFRLNLAKMYLQAGEPSLAKAQLSVLSNLGEKFAGQSEVARLLKPL